MIGQKQTLLAFAGVALLATGVAAQQKPGAAPVTPKPAAQRPNDEGAAPKPATKFVTPIKGVAEIQLTEPKMKREGNFVISTMKVKNVSAGPIAGLKVDVFWYDKAGNPVSGAPTFRAKKPVMPGEVIDVELKAPSVPTMVNNQYKFEHANGAIKPTKVAKFKE